MPRILDEVDEAENAAAEQARWTADSEFNRTFSADGNFDLL